MPRPERDTRQASAPDDTRPRPPAWFDAHLDLAFLALIGRDLTASDPRASDDPLQPGFLTLPALAEGGVATVLATVFTEPEGLPDSGAVDPRVQYDPSDPRSAFHAGAEQINLYHRLARDGHLALPASSWAREHGWTPDARPAAGILVENAEPILSPSELAWWKDRGVVAVGLTWATPNRYACGNATPPDQDTGLSDAGRDLVHAMDDLGLVHDASHLSDRSLDDLFNTTNARVIASHSNCRALLTDSAAYVSGDRAPAAQRHLTDDAIREIARRDGVVGLNLYRKFLAPPSRFQTNPRHRPTIDQTLDHVRRVVELTGSARHVGLGSDADGGLDATDLPDGLDHPRDYDRLAAALGWTDDDTRAFQRGNWDRVFPALGPALGPALRPASATQ
ncbi:MAG: membrane dipeptidase [Planctomycetota bacterium]